MPRTLSSRIATLTADRVPFVHATVVRAQIPTSARAGDDAIILTDGTIEGFVGGQCAESSVRTAALNTLTVGESMLLRILPEDDVSFPETPGAQVVVNPCLSGGALEIFLEPNLPSPLLAIVGHAPVAVSLAQIAAQLGWEVALDEGGTIDLTADACVIASHGNNEESTITAALHAGVPYIGLVASPRRGRALLAELGLDEADRARISTPAGLDIGARTAGEIALSILTEIVIELRAGRLARGGRTVPARPVQVIDPVCGMTVTVMPDTPTLSLDGTDHWFCGPGCRDRYAELSAH